MFVLKESLAALLPFLTAMCNASVLEGNLPHSNSLLAGLMSGLLTKLHTVQNAVHDLSQCPGISTNLLTPLVTGTSYLSAGASI
jgi:hypothetical protein